MNLFTKIILGLTVTAGLCGSGQAQDPFVNANTILVIGNSLSLQEPQKEQNWEGNWGMAATSGANDYLHLLKKELDRLYPENSHTLNIRRLNDEAQMSGYDHLLKEKADLVIVQVGENFGGKLTTEDLGRKYASMLRTIKQHISPNIICLGTWLTAADGSLISSILEQEARNLQIPYIAIGSLAKNSNLAAKDPRFAKAPDKVKKHPSDKGMQYIARQVAALSPRLYKDAVSASISVDAQKIIGDVNRKIMGQFVEGADGQYIWGYDTPNWKIRGTGDGVWDSKQEKPVEKVVELLKALRPGVIRYPGGSEAKNYNWKLVVGPLKQRQEGWHWGLVEFLTFCRQVGAEPQICLSEYVGGPEDQRELVEFLNAPATPEHPWAMKRKEWGNKEPFNVKYFELGNEPYDGNRRVVPRKQWDAAGYAQWAKKTAELMRTVDPSIKIGLPVGGFGKEGDDLILKEVGPVVDFAVHHTYSIGYAGNRDLTSQEEDCIMRACMVAAEQRIYKLQNWRQSAQKLTGKDFELAITEYNTEMQSEFPRPYRKSLGAGIFCTDYMFKMMQPENKIMLANYWQMVNGYWGSIVSTENFALLPPYFCFLITANHLGDKLLEPAIKCPKVEFEGFFHAAPARGNAYLPNRIMPLNLYSEKQVFLPPAGMKIPGLEVKKVNDEIQFKMNKFTGVNYPSFATIQVKGMPREFQPAAGVSYELSFEACLEKEPGSGKLNLGLGIMDSRGWEIAGSAIGVEGVEKPEWQKFSGIYPPLKDTPSIILLGRLLGGSTPVTGIMRIRNIAVKPVLPETFPAYDCLSVLSSRTGNKVYVLIINKYTDRKVNTTLDFDNFKITSLSQSAVNAPEAGSTAGAFITRETPLSFKNNRCRISLEPHSITAITADGN